MKEMTATWMERAGDVRDIQNVIEAEYHIVTEEPSKGGGEIGELAAKADEVVGEGFNINLEWLKESQKTLNWSDDTMLSFLAAPPYKVSGKNVIEALGKLTREQAVNFTSQINTKVENTR
ncbi:hypothetical protein ES708_27928 [subsurface metagenome]